MPFNYLLTNLLVDVPAAVGAIFLDDEGEAVDWVTRHDDPFDLKVEGAFHSIFKRRLDLIGSSTSTGPVESYVVAGKGMTSLTHALPDGYYLVLVLDRPDLTGRALYYLRRTAGIFARELP